MVTHVCFCKNLDHVNVPMIKIDGYGNDRVDRTKVLAVTMYSDFTWNAHVENIISKASKRVYLLYQLKRPGASQNDLLKVLLSVIRPVLEYTCQVWHTNLTQYLSEGIETVEKRALRVIFPGHSYDESLQVTSLPTLSQRSQQMCKHILRSCRTSSISSIISCQTSDRYHTAKG